jgi:hypothetical protein
VPGGCAAHQGAHDLPHRRRPLVQVVRLEGWQRGQREHRPGLLEARAAAVGQRLRQGQAGAGGEDRRRSALCARPLAHGDDHGRTHVGSGSGVLQGGHQRGRRARAQEVQGAGMLLARQVGQRQRRVRSPPLLARLICATSTATSQQLHQVRDLRRSGRRGAGHARSRRQETIGAPAWRRVN